VATVGLVLASLALGMIIAAKIVSRMHFDQVQELTEAMQEARDFTDMQRAMLDYMEAHGGYPGWMAAVAALLLLSMPTWLAALICSVIGLRRPDRRGRTVASLILVGVFPVIMCCVG
jgi:hypothetical protein